MVLEVKGVNSCCFLGARFQEHPRGAGLIILELGHTVCVADGRVIVLFVPCLRVHEEFPPPPSVSPSAPPSAAAR